MIAYKRDDLKMYETKLLRTEVELQLETSMDKGLDLMEKQLTANSVAKRDDATAQLNGWKGELQKFCKKGFHFEGMPINFSVNDPNKIKARIFDRYEDWLLDEDQDCIFAVGVHVEPYYCSVNSVWVYVAKLSPLPEED